MTYRPHIEESALVSEIYTHMGSYCQLPSMLSLLAGRLRADAACLILDLGNGYIKETYASRHLGPVNVAKLIRYLEERDSRLYGSHFGTAQPEAGYSDSNSFPDQRDQRFDTCDVVPFPPAAHAGLATRRLGVGTAGRRGAPRSALTMIRLVPRPGFISGELVALGRILPHVDKAISLTHALQTAQESAALAAGALERLGHGLLLLDIDGIVLYSNGRARDLLSRRADVRLGRRLELLDAACADRYLQALRKAADPGRGMAADILLPDLVGDEALRLEVSSAQISTVFQAHAPRGEPHGIRGQAVACVTVEPASSQTPPLLRGYGLTPAEARLCLGLLSGRCLKACARDWNLSYDTLRSQLKTVFRKTCTHRQAELIAILSALEPALKT